MFRETFYGQTISNYGRENGRVDYGTLAKSFDAVLCNGILGYRDGWEDWEQISGWIDHTEELNELRAELEEVSEKLEEATKAKKEAELDYDKADTAYDNISEILEKFDNFEYDYNELDEALRWNDTETPSGEELDTDDITSQLDCLNLWGMREDIERHQNTAEEERDEAEERFEEAEEEVNKLTKRRDELNEQIEELEEEDTTDAEVFQWYIISDNGAQILQENLPSEILYYNAELDLYVWGVTHSGTAWDYVLTSIPCETYDQTKEREAEEFEAQMQKAYDRIKAETDDLENEDIEIVEEDSKAEPWFDEPRADEPSHTPTEEEAEAVEQNENDTLALIDWDVAHVGDVVIGKPSASERYAITREGWKGIIETLSYDGDTVVGFFAHALNGGDENSYGLDVKHFNVYQRVAEC